MKEIKGESVHVRISEQTKKKLQQIAAKNERPISFIIRKAIETYAKG